MTALLLSQMMLVVPAVGMPNESLLQDTFKSMIVSMLALTASFAFFWPRRKAGVVLRFHGVLALPLALMLYALCSMVWSHTYLGGVEAVRWFIFSLVLFLGMNTLTQARVTWLAWGIHVGAVMASLWAALQFWFDWSFFAQAHHPASTFVNRNFFAEFVVCTLPWSVLLLTCIRDKTSVFLLTFSIGFNVVALMMTGTRSALAGLLFLLPVLPTLAFMYRRQWVSCGWTAAHGLGLLALFLSTILSLGNLPTANIKLINEFGQSTAIDRAFKRTLSMTSAEEYRSGSFSIRAQMWQATTLMIAAHPLTGVGAGAWEVHIPLFQDANTQMEIDYYAHNELLQLLAEYGMVGWGFLLILLAFLCRAAYLTWSDRSAASCREAPLRAFTLVSLLVLVLVSNAGFAWRLAGTGALFALGLAVLAASDVRRHGLSVGRWYAQGHHCVAALCLTAVCTGPAMVIAQQAIECETKLVRATKLALTISASGVPNDPFWAKDRGELLQLLKQGIAINPHYRKITPMVADALASWGDWENAIGVWQSVLASRPFVVVILANVARGQIQMGNLTAAQDFFDRAKRIQPNAASLTSLQVLLWSRTGHEQQAMQKAQALLQTGVIDRDLVQVAYTLGLQQHRPELAILALELGIKTWPKRAVDGWLKLGDIYNSADAFDTTKAKHAYQNALKATDPAYVQIVLNRIPAIYRSI